MVKAKGVKKAFAKAKNSIGAIAVAAVLLGGIGVIAVNATSPRPEIVSAGIQPVEAVPGAKLKIDREEAELGTISVDEVASADFKLTNAGTAPVEISQVGTSCMCTFADVQLPGEKSPEFNMTMHNEPTVNAWTGTLAPGETAVVTVTYQPSLMPVEGSVARNVKFATSDPQRPKVELGVHATVTGKSAG
ncbi:DUF1573 domain-containing protein [Aurantimonas sp. 22II-16-19i]|nr:DUF1573 domain-containing protein [Aurantimonas sp. 22II-16-19i]ORE97013.1 hypothetical protein ATO4_10949 [Aurantimonas sp. 22II-16-19i]